MWLRWFWVGLSEVWRAVIPLSALQIVLSNLSEEKQEPATRVQVYGWLLGYVIVIGGLIYLLWYRFWGNK